MDDYWYGMLTGAVLGLALSWWLHSEELKKLQKKIKQYEKILWDE